MMKLATPTNGNHSVEVEDLKARLAVAEDTLSAIYRREVDALIVGGPGGEQVFTLHGAETSYRLLVEAMNEGALTLGPEGTILYCNKRFAEMINCPIEQVIGSALETRYTYDKEGKGTLLRSPKLLLNDNFSGKPEDIYLMTGRRPQAAFGNSTAWLRA